jgi:uncharacterized membrane protein YkgB
MKNINARLENFDHALIQATRRWHMPFARFALFLIYFWFGALKVFSESPANPLVNSLLERTLPWMSFSTFIVLFGVFEMVIGITFLIPRLERLGVFLLAVHLITTVMPLFVLPAVTWTAPFTPTLEGQYIIKNVLIIALAIGVISNVRSFKEAKMSQNG